MKKKLGVLTAALILASCGGGGGELSTSSTSNTSTPKTKEITATVESSLVKGALVCVKGTSNCAITDDKGVAHLRVNSLPVELEVKVGGLVLGDVGSSSDTVRINPLLLAEGNLQVAQAIANIIHALGGDPEGENTVVDLSGVEVETPLSESIEELLKKGKEVEIKVKKGGKEHSVAVEKPADSEEVLVTYDSNPCAAPDIEKILLWKMATFLSAADGKKVSILSSKTGETVECTLEVNSDEPNQFKLADCSNPDYNDDTWEEVRIEDGKLIVEDEDGKIFQVSDINLITFTIKLNGEEEELTVWITDAPALVPQMSQEEINEKLEKGKFDLVYSYLSTKKELTDSERVALAVAVLGKAVKDNLMVPAGLSIISPEDSPFFKVVENGNQVQLKALEEGSKELLPQIEKALEELDKVKEPCKVEIPSNLGTEAKTLDETSLKALKALLLYAKSNLEYLLAYDWNTYQSDLGKKYPSVLELASKLKLTEDKYLNKSYEDFKKSAEVLYEAGSEVIKTKPSADGLTYAFIKPTSDGYLINDELWTEENLETFIENFKTVANSGSGAVDIRLPKDPSDPSTPVNDHWVNLSVLFNSPLTGEQFKEDVDSANAIEVNFCTSWAGYTDPDGEWHEECIEYERDIWITADSNLYKFLESIYSDVKNKLREPFQYNGKTYYSLQGFYVEPEYSDYYVVYPRK